mmetsp:Transcript_25142/g.49238  ORF Transcript_25142/g.49238 Transcript_25142/m.49238 type:complete len:109 (-) Transcript_25142:143-469(-)
MRAMHRDSTVWLLLKTTTKNLNATLQDQTEPTQSQKTTCRSTTKDCVILACSGQKINAPKAPPADIATCRMEICQNASEGPSRQDRGCAIVRAGTHKKKGTMLFLGNL